MQGGSPQGYSSLQPWYNSAYNEDGSLRPDYMLRLEKILDKANESVDFRMKDEPYVDGYQSVPVDWGINSKRKIGFFKLLKEITGNN